MPNKWYYSRESPSRARRKKIGAAIGAGIACSFLAVIILFPSVIPDSFSKIVGILKPPASENSPNTTRIDDDSDDRTLTDEPNGQPDVPDDDSSRSTNDLIPTSIAKKVHVLVNQHRDNNGIPDMSYDNKLASIALDHSQDMAENDFFDHVNLNGQDPTDRADKAGYSCYKELGDGYYTIGIAENIAQVNTYDSVTYVNGIPFYDWLTEDEIVEDIFEGWKNSPLHNENMLEKNYDREGLGIAIDTDGEVYATQNFC